MLTIRFARMGKKNKAQFKIMLQEKSVAPGGRHIEILGSYDPHQKKAVLKEDRIRYWVEKGASLSDTAHNLFVSKGVIVQKKRPVKISKKGKDVKEKTNKKESKIEEKSEEKKTE